MTYQLPNGERVEIHDDVARGASVVSYTLKGGRVVDAVRCSPLDLDDAMQTVFMSSVALKGDLDRLEVRIGQLLSERAHIIAVLTAFYKSDITLSSLNPVLDLAVMLNPSLKGGTSWTALNNERPVR